MRRMAGWRALRTLVLAAVVPGMATGCGGKKERDASDCPAGTESCPCYGNGTCNGALSCVAGHCVDQSPASGGTAGTTAAACAAGELEPCLGADGCTGAREYGLDGQWGSCICLQAQGGTGGALPTGGTGGLLPPLGGTAGDVPGGTAGDAPGGAGGDVQGGTGGTTGGWLTGLVRDFSTTFPDMEPGDSGKELTADAGMVASTIGPDSKPVYVGPADGTPTTTGPANFDLWYRDAPGTNITIPLELQFADPDGDGVWTYDDQAFFPIDDQGFGNEGNTHNYHFTFELHTTFIYHGGEVFTFIGDDDVFAYINGQLVVDLGGIHNAETGTVNLDTLGLTVGEEYMLDFFFAERHVIESHFRIDTTIEFEQSILIY
jgi:fibro-slime domain-containing protein